MNTTDFLTIILTSALVSSIVAFALRVLFENKQQHKFDVELEKVKSGFQVSLEKNKADIAMHADIERKFALRKLEKYPKAVELVYRTRNLARSITTPNIDPAALGELQIEVDEFEDILYESRIDFQKDGLFAGMHSYKNLLRTFSEAAGELAIPQKDKEDANALIANLKKLYESIDLSHAALIQDLSSKAA